MGKQWVTVGEVKLAPTPPSKGPGEAKAEPCWALFPKDSPLPLGEAPLRPGPTSGKTTSSSLLHPGNQREAPRVRLTAVMLSFYPGLPFPPEGPSTHRGPCPPPHPREPQVSNLQPPWPLSQVLCFKQCPLPRAPLPVGSPSVGPSY